jgi:hypothetical protein
MHRPRHRLHGLKRSDRPIQLDPHADAITCFVAQPATQASALASGNSKILTAA